MESIQEVDLTDETTTTHSQMTKSLATHNKFIEIEASIRRHQQAVAQHKIDLAQVNERALTTLTLVEKTASDVQHLTIATTDQITALRNEMRNEAAAQAQAQLDGFERMTALILRLTTPPNTDITEWQPPNQQTLAAYRSPDSTQDSDTMSTETLETDNQSSLAASPIKKKNRSDHRPSDLDDVRIQLNQSAQYDQEKSARNNSPRTPDAGDT